MRMARRGFPTLRQIPGGFATTKQMVRESLLSYGPSVFTAFLVYLQGTFLPSLACSYYIAIFAFAFNASLLYLLSIPSSPLLTSLPPFSPFQCYKELEAHFLAAVGRCSRSYCHSIVSASLFSTLSPCYIFVKFSRGSSAQFLLSPFSILSFICILSRFSIFHS